MDQLKLAFSLVVAKEKIGPSIRGVCDVFWLSWVNTSTGQGCLSVVSQPDQSEYWRDCYSGDERSDAAGAGATVCYLYCCSRAIYTDANIGKDQVPVKSKH